MQEPQFHVGQPAVYLPTGKKVLIVEIDNDAAPNPVVYCQQTDGEKLIFPVPHRLITLFLGEYVEQEVPRGPVRINTETAPHQKLEKQ